MNLQDLLAPWCQDQRVPPITIQNLVLDSRMVKPHDLYVALSDQPAYAQEAISKGAAAILVDLHMTPHAVKMNASSYPVIPISSLKVLLPELAKRFYGDLTRNTIAGVTGTNGKTSTTHFIAALSQGLGERTGIIGTLGTGFLGALATSTHTTPDIFSLYASLWRLFKEGATKVAMEVSSHSIAQKRIASVPFAYGVFTNLTQDHLDYHGTMDAYANTKRAFLAQQDTHTLVINSDDATARSWLPDLAKTHALITYGFEEAPVETPHLYIRAMTHMPKGLGVTLESSWGLQTLQIPLLGAFNVSNVVAAMAILLQEGADLRELAALVPTLKGVPGRMQAFSVDAKPQIVIDYAHTPDALSQVLQTLREHLFNGRLYCVFGCGGDRDVSKRPLMGAIAEKWADRIIITNDNPRSEDPTRIVEDIQAGMHHRDAHAVILDRAEAIQTAISEAKLGDVVLVAGKGAEREQIIGDKKLPFSDEAVVRQCGVY